MYPEKPQWEGVQEDPGHMSESPHLAPCDAEEQWDSSDLQISDCVFPSVRVKQAARWRRLILAKTDVKVT